MITRNNEHVLLIAVNAVVAASSVYLIALIWRRLEAANQSSDMLTQMSDTRH